MDRVLVFGQGEEMMLALQIFPFMCVVTYGFQKLFYAKKYKDGRLLVKRIKGILYWSVLFRAMIMTYLATVLWIFIYVKSYSSNTVEREDFQTTQSFRRMLIEKQQSYTSI